MTFRHQVVYQRIVEHAKTFEENWNLLSYKEKVEHKLILQKKYSIKEIEEINEAINELPLKPIFLNDTLNTCNMLLWGKLEIFAADYDIYGIELGNYARYIFDVYRVKFRR